MQAKKEDDSAGFWILDDTLRVSIRYEHLDSDLRDNVKISIYESCPEDEKLFLADETNIFLTADEAQKIADALLTAIHNKRAGR
jgi:hypothetical protein